MLHFQAGHGISTANQVKQVPTMKDKVGLIGFGRFGRELAKILAGDFEVLVFDHSDSGAETLPAAAVESIKPAPLREALACQTIFYAVPIEQFEQALTEHLPYFRAEPKERLLVDVLSVKLYPKQIFERLLPSQTRALLTHPMFGPDSIKIQGLSGLPLVLDRFTAADTEYTFWKNFFSNKGLRILEMTAVEHDRAAANSQGITHFIGRVLDEMNFAATPLDTLGAKKLQEIREQTCNDTWELFVGLQNKNPYTIDMRVRLGAAVDQVYSKLLPNRIHADRLVVGIQGGHGSFNEEAATYYLKRAGIERYELVYLYTTAQVLKALHEGQVDRGQFAIHNSTGGLVDESIEAMANYKFKITEQFAIKIAHALMIHPRAALDRVDTIMTHPQVLRQCKRSLAEKYSRLKLTSGAGELIDHANVAQHLAAGKLPITTATMGSKILAELYGLRVVEDNLQDLQENYTSFLWVERVS